MRRRIDRALHLKLLRARAAAERVELALAMRSISERLAPLRSVADSLGSVTAALGRRGRMLKWVALIAGALIRARRFRRLAAAAIPGVRGTGRAVVLAAFAAGALATALRKGQRVGRSEEGEQPPRATPAEATADAAAGNSHGFAAQVDRGADGEG